MISYFYYLYIYLIYILFTELRLARLALDPSNSPAWEVPEQELRPSTKMPLFVGAHPVYTSQIQSDVCKLSNSQTSCGENVNPYNVCYLLTIFYLIL